MGLAKVLCVLLIILGVALCVADIREASQYGQSLALAGASRHVWQWGLVCIISGVLGIVVLAIAGPPEPADKP